MKAYKVLCLVLLVISFMACTRDLENSKSEIIKAVSQTTEATLIEEVKVEPEVDPLEDSTVQNGEIEPVGTLQNSGLQGEAADGNVSTTSDEPAGTLENEGTQKDTMNNLHLKWKIAGGFSLFLNLLFIFMLYRIYRNLQNYKIEYKLLKSKYAKSKQNQAFPKGNYQDQIHSLKRNNFDLQRHIDKLQKENDLLIKKNISPRPPEINQRKAVDQTKENLNQEIFPKNPPVTLYAGKPSHDKCFTGVTPQQDEYKSIFKLILESREANKAKFEVINSDYILKMVVNSPDTYLYDVCIPSNSNQNFDKEIVTVEKGTAHLVDGNWRVTDADKAKIKFQ